MHSECKIMKSKGCGTYSINRMPYSSRITTIKQFLCCLFVVHSHWCFVYDETILSMKLSETSFCRKQTDFLQFTLTSNDKHLPLTNMICVCGYSDSIFNEENGDTLLHLASYHGHKVMILQTLLSHFKLRSQLHVGKKKLRRHHDFHCL